YSGPPRWQGLGLRLRPSQPTVSRRCTSLTALRQWRSRGFIGSFNNSTQILKGVATRLNSSSTYLPPRAQRSVSINLRCYLNRYLNRILVVTVGDEVTSLGSWPVVQKDEETSSRTGGLGFCKAPRISR